VRIIGGSLRGRCLQVPAGRDMRPTADRARQTLFNLIAHSAALGGLTLEGATVADIFAGTGAFGLEALSRGARRALFIESGRASLTALRANIAALGLVDRSQVIARDAVRPGPAPTPCDLLFLDPPYREGFVLPALAALMQNAWLAPGAVVIVEHATDEDLQPPDGMATLKTHKVGAATFANWHMLP